MSASTATAKPFTATFKEFGTEVRLELTNSTAQRLKNVEILTIFLKDDETPGAPSRVHLKFEAITSIQPQERSALAHRTWIDGKPVDAAHDQLSRLQALVSGGKRYVLDISWEDPEGKTQFQRIPVGV